MKEIVFASNNEGKWLELADDFKNVGINLILSKEKLNLIEDDRTLKANSLSKAKCAAKQTGKMSLGDDSGIFVTDLKGFPGVSSRRWFGAATDDLARNKKLLDMMSYSNKRDVHLISYFSLVDKDQNEISEFVVDNLFSLAYEVKGTHGFGYDSILIPGQELLNGAVSRGVITSKYAEEILEQQTTIGELDQKLKNDINNRGRIAIEISKALEENCYGN